MDTEPWFLHLYARFVTDQLSADQSEKYAILKLLYILAISEKKKVFLYHSNIALFLDFCNGNK